MAPGAFGAGDGTQSLVYAASSLLPSAVLFLASGFGLSALCLIGSIAVPKDSAFSKKHPGPLAWSVTFWAALLQILALAVWLACQGLAPGQAGPVPAWVVEQVETGAWQRTCCVFFLASCAVESIFSQVRGQGEVPLGSLHQVAYSALVLYLLVTDRCAFFPAIQIQQLPVLMEATYKLQGDFRPRLLTGLSIFLGISVHLCVTYSALRNDLHLGVLLFVLSYGLLNRFRTWFLLRVQCKVSEDAACRPEGSAARRLTMGVGSHFFFIGVLIAMHLVLHLGLTASHQSGALQVDEMTVETHSGRRMADLLIQGLLFMAFARVMGLTIWDAYNKHFIEVAISKQTVIYNISWEDPRVEREFVNFGSEDVILTISSAGCNVLDYLIEGPKAIVACDFNPGQLAILELKLACIKHLSYDQFFKIWAESDYGTFVAVYEPLLRSTLSESAREFWDGNHGFIKDNFMYAGSSGLIARLVLPFLAYVGMVEYMEKRLRRPPVTMGFALVQKVVYSHWFLSMFLPLAGVPESQFELLQREPEVLVERWKDILGRRMWAMDNYFYYGYLVGKWTKDCCPRYLEECNFEKLQRFAGRVTLFHGPIADAAKVRDDFTFASLLDSMDWMPDSMIAEQLAVLLPRMKGGSSIFWRSFATKVHSPVLAMLRPAPVVDDGSERVGFYMSQWLAKAPEKEDYGEFLHRPGGCVFMNTVLEDLSVMAAMVGHALRKEKDVELFYKTQGSNYDGFREALLPDRDRLLRYCLPWQQRPKVWLSVGCGTARDIEYVADHIKACGTRLFLLDLSPDLLKMAAQRVRHLGLADQTTLILADVCKAFRPDGSVDPSQVKAFDGHGRDVGPAGLSALAGADVVTCSFCLTMIPPWEAALEAMVRALRPGGTLALIDFTKRSDGPQQLAQQLYQRYFAMDGVYFNEAHTQALRTRPDLRTTWFHETEARVPYTPLWPTHYLWSGVKTN